MSSGSGSVKQDEIAISPKKLEALERAVKALEDGQGPKFLLLSGRPGTGKRSTIEYLLARESWEIVGEDDWEIGETIRHLADQTEGLAVGFTGKDSGATKALAAIAHAQFKSHYGSR